jgi:uncharacterized protein (TIRG00374 family)
LKKPLAIALKFVVPAVIIGLLVYSVWSHKPDSPDEAGTFELVGQAAWSWGPLAAAFVLFLAAVCVTFCRWYLLVRALELKFRLRDAFRLGFLGFLFNYVGAGSVGGDLFKAVFIAREQPGRRTEAVASVVVDRMIGLYGLLLVTSTALFFADFEEAGPQLHAFRQLTYLVTTLGGIVILLILVPGFTRGSVTEFLGSLPKVGPTLERLIGAVRMYRRKKGTLLATCLMSVGVHTVLSVCIWFLALGLFFKVPELAVPTLLEHLLIAPLSNACAALPISPAGWGTYELALEMLYRILPAEAMRAGQGLAVALGYRVVQIGVVVIGVIYYWVDRREVSELMHETEREEGGGHRGGASLRDPVPAAE